MTAMISIAFAQTPTDIANRTVERSAIWPPGTFIANYPATFITDNNNVSMTLGKTLFIPIYSPESKTITKLDFVVVHNCTFGKKVRVALYTSDENGLPSTIKVDAGEVMLPSSCAAGAPVTITIPPHGISGSSWFWFAINPAQTASINFLAFIFVAEDITSAGEPLVFTNPAISTTANLLPGYMMREASVSYRAFPVTAPSTSQSSNPYTPIVGIGY